MLTISHGVYLLLEVLASCPYEYLSLEAPGQVLVLRPCEVSIKGLGKEWWKSVNTGNCFYVGDNRVPIKKSDNVSGR